MDPPMTVRPLGLRTRIASVPVRPPVRTRGVEGSPAAVGSGGSDRWGGGGGTLAVVRGGADPLRDRLRRCDHRGKRQELGQPRGSRSGSRKRRRPARPEPSSLDGGSADPRPARTHWASRRRCRRRSGRSASGPSRPWRRRRGQRGADDDAATAEFNAAGSRLRTPCSDRLNVFADAASTLDTAKQRGQRTPSSGPARPVTNRAPHPSHATRTGSITEAPSVSP